jgi:peptidoglycan/LPS O-acetylase OafA/YrhL
MTALTLETSQPSRTDAMSFDRFAEMRHFPSMTGIRCVCALMVIKEHVLFQIPAPRLVELGWLGVDMFFVISGFLIVTLLLRERSRTGSIDLRGFYTRRTFRIFPIYYLLLFGVVATAMALSPWAPNTLNYYKGSVLVLLLYLQDIVVVPMGLFFHTWSLAMEEQFYLVWPTVEKYLKGVWLGLVLVALLVVSQLVNFGVFSAQIDALYGLEEASQRPIFLITFTPILLGVAMAHLMNRRESFAAVAKVVVGRWRPLIILMLAVAVCELAPVNIQGLPRLLLHVLFCAFLASVVLTPSHVFSFFLEHPWVERLGAISYGIYLYHTLIIDMLSRILKSAGYAAVPPGFMFVVVSVLAIAAAEASFRFIESPLLRFAHRQRVSAKAAAVRS